MFHCHAEARLRVRYAETDQMGVVYHANYLVWFEVGRVELMRALGLEYKLLEQDFGCMIAVVEAKARYRAPARYDDEVAVRTSLAAMRGPVLKMEYQVVRVGDGVLLCEGETMHVVVDRSIRKRLLPAPYAEAFRALLHQQEPDEL
jgi:acyl-CoA thioester hydrolase